MTSRDQFGSGPDGKDELELRCAASEETEAKLEQALADFRSSVHAWSEAAYRRPRTVELTLRHRSWRLAAGWALGCALVAGGVSGAVVEHQRQQQAARVAAAEQQARQQQTAAAQQRVGRQDPGLMADVDSDTAQEVPDAMQPLAQMMEDSGNQ